MRTNKTVLDVSKVQHGTYYWINQYGQIYHSTPLCNSVRLERVFKDELALPHPDYIGETTYDRAKRLGILDVWKPVVSFQLTANHTITFTGKKAEQMWGIWMKHLQNK